MALFGPPNVAKLDAKGDIAGLVKAAKYTKDPALAEQARLALEGRLERIVESLATKHMVQLENAREALVVIGPAARERLIFILKNGHLHRRQDAAFVLGMMGDPEAVGPLTIALHNPDPLLRMICVEAPGQDRRFGLRRHPAEGSGRQRLHRLRRRAKGAQKAGSAPAAEMRRACRPGRCWVQRTAR